ncbi:MAG: hypothetical protein ACKORL_06800, partial [Phycisphaerales bacterium]
MLTLDVAGGLSAAGTIRISAVDIDIQQAFGDSDDLTTITARGNGSIGVGDATGARTISGAELGRVTASTLELVTTGSGAITVNGVAEGQSANVGLLKLTTAALGGNVVFSGGASTFNRLTVSAGSTLDVDAAIAVDTGSMSLTGTTGIELGANLTAANNDVLLASATTLTGGVTVNAGSGAVTFSSTVSGRQALSVTGGDISFSGVVGTSVDAPATLSSLTVSGTVVDLGSVFVDGGANVTGTTRVDLNGTTYDSTTAGF